MRKTPGPRVRSLRFLEFSDPGEARRPADERAAKARGRPTAHQPTAIPRAALVRGRKCPATNAVKTFCLTRTKLHVCESIDALHKTALHPVLFKKTASGSGKQE